MYQVHMAKNRIKLTTLVSEYCWAMLIYLDVNHPSCNTDYIKLTILTSWMNHKNQYKLHMNVNVLYK